MSGNALLGHYRKDNREREGEALLGRLLKAQQVGHFVLVSFEMLTG
jgi:hypothetical protein